MKKLVLIIALSGLAINAHAMLGETKQQSINRYGRPFSEKGNLTYFRQKGFIVAEWFDSAGIAEVIGYWKLNGYITKAEHDKIGAANLPAEVKVNDWIEQNSQDPNTRLWMTLDSRWCFESGLSRLGFSKNLYSSELIGTVVGAQQMLAEINRQNGNQEIPADNEETRRTDL